MMVRPGLFDDIRFVSCSSVIQHSMPGRYLAAMELPQRAKVEQQEAQALGRSYISLDASSSTVAGSLRDDMCLFSHPCHPAFHARHGMPGLPAVGRRPLVRGDQCAKLMVARAKRPGGPATFG